MPKVLSLENAEISDAGKFVKMIFDSASYFSELFGKKIKNALYKLYEHPANLFSCDHTKKVLYDGQTAALILAYSENNKKKENLRTGLLLFRYLQFSLLKNVSVLGKFNSTVGDLPENSYYISNIATSEEFRHKGAARLLMNDAETEAKKRFCDKLILDVEPENSAAVSLYKSLGYTTDDTFFIPFRSGFNLNLIRMIKVI